MVVPSAGLLTTGAEMVLVVGAGEAVSSLLAGMVTIGVVGVGDGATVVGGVPLEVVTGAKFNVKLVDEERPSLSSTVILYVLRPVFRLPNFVPAR